MVGGLHCWQAVLCVMLGDLCSLQTHTMVAVAVLKGKPLLFPARGPKCTGVLSVCLQQRQ